MKELQTCSNVKCKNPAEIIEANKTMRLTVYLCRSCARKDSVTVMDSSPGLAELHWTLLTPMSERQFYLGTVEICDEEEIG